MMQPPLPTSGQVVVSLEPSSVRMLADGDPVQVTATVHNSGETPNEYKIEIAELDPSWYTLETKGVLVPPGDRVPVSIALHPRSPKGDTIRVAKYNFTVQATLSDDPTQFGVTTGTIEIVGA